MATPLLVGLGVAGAAFAARAGIRAVQALKSRPMPKMKIPGMGAGGYIQGGFKETMDAAEAKLILSFEASSKPTMEMVKENHKRIMKLNHPDLGGSPLLAAKVNEAKTLLLKQR
eukprot:TRINITY_DN2499_c0_g1_i3.p1 TRINITY_DN2499_c0_g1~~TRINITY_DN2499_c0_g1_i3.p1  ORF type:complete len:114 (-),score=16.05 TRINITY_DN2499_c0_g1_i3:181-522(-)